MKSLEVKINKDKRYTIEELYDLGLNFEFCISDLVIYKKHNKKYMFKQIRGKYKFFPAYDADKWFKE